MQSSFAEKKSLSGLSVTFLVNTMEVEIAHKGLTGSVRRLFCQWFAVQYKTHFVRVRHNQEIGQQNETNQCKIPHTVE